MNTIKNLARKPLQVPLPHGKRLHLPFGQTGQISDDALEHPPVKKLIDEGLIEVLGHSTGHSVATASEGPMPHESGPGNAPGSTAAAPRRGNRGD